MLKFITRELSNVDLSLCLSSLLFYYYLQLSFQFCSKSSLQNQILFCLAESSYIYLKNPQNYQSDGYPLFVSVIVLGCKRVCLQLQSTEFNSKIGSFLSSICTFDAMLNYRCWNQFDIKPQSILVESQNQSSG